MKLHGIYIILKSLLPGAVHNVLNIRIEYNLDVYCNGAEPTLLGEGLGEALLAFMAGGGGGGGEPLAERVGEGDGDADAGAGRLREAGAAAEDAGKRSGEAERERDDCLLIGRGL